VQGCVVTVNPVPPKDIALDQPLKSKTLIVSKYDVEGKNILPSEVISGVRRSFANIGYYGPYSEKYTGRKTLLGGKIFSAKGVIVGNNSEDSLLDIEYVNGVMVPDFVYYSRSRGKSYNEKGYKRLATVSTQLKYEVESDSEHYKVNFVYPEKVNDDLAYDNRTHIASIEEIIEDFKIKFKGLENIRLNKSVKIEGEVNSEYSKESTFANFKRILGEPRTGYDDKLIFDYKLNSNISEIYVYIYTYRDGSKVKYDLQLPYTIGMESSITQQDIDNIKNEIAGIVNN